MGREAKKQIVGRGGKASQKKKPSHGGGGTIELRQPPWGKGGNSLATSEESRYRAAVSPVLVEVEKGCGPLWKVLQETRGGKPAKAGGECLPQHNETWEAYS